LTTLSSLSLVTHTTGMTHLRASWQQLTTGFPKRPINSELCGTCQT